MSGMSTSKKTPILVADDDEFMLVAISQYLENAGYLVLKAENGEEAIAIFKEHTPELVLLDGNMPKVDGFQACKAIKGCSGKYSVPVIMVTALDDVDSVQKAFAVGADEYITKPINWAVLAQRVRLLVKQKVAEQKAYWAHQSQRLISALLQEEDPSISLAEQLEQSLALILAIDWLPSEEAGVIFLLDEKSNELVLTAQKKLDDYILESCARVPLGKCLCGRAASSRCVVFSEHMDGHHKVYYEGLVDHGNYCIPINSSKGLLGVLNLYIKAGTPLDLQVQATLITVGSTLANIIERKKMEEEIKAHRDRLTFEREFIEEIVTRMHNAKRFDPRNVRILQNPMEKTAGDLVLSAFRPDGAQHILLGDFTGHGLPSAIGGPAVANIFYSMTNKGFCSSEILTEINQLLYEQTPTGMFMATGFLMMDPARSQLTVWNCSIPDILVFRQGKLHERVISSCFARGMVNVPDRPGTEINMLPGDRIFTYTDGFTEEQNNDGIMLGQKNFEKMLTQMLVLDEPFEAIMNALKSYRGGNEQSDDMTMVELIC
jgi:DNA-binding response OmpR family regulator